MGKKEAIQEYKNEQKALAQQEFTDSINRAAQTIIREIDPLNAVLLHNLSTLLGEKYELTDKSGKKYVIEGQFNNAEAGTYGTKEVFEEPEFFGQPFNEVSRDMHSHFKMYCLVNGVTDEEMMSFAQENPPKEITEKLRSMKKGFFDMVAGKDLNAITDYYVGIANYAEQKLPALMSCSDLRNFPKNVDNIVLLGGSASFLQQSICLVGYEEKTEMQQQLIDRVNQRLREQGKTYTLADVQTSLHPAENAAVSLTKYRRLFHNTSFDALSFDVITSEKLDGVDYSGGYVALGLLSRLCREIKQKGQMQGVDASRSFVNFSVVEREAALRALPPQELFQSELDNYISAPQRPSDAVDDLAERLQGNVRKGFFGKKENSEKYDNVLKAAQEVSRQEKEIAKLQREGGTPSIKMMEDLQKAYQDMDKVAKTYLDSRNPATREGIDRYKLVLESQSLAKSGLQKQEKALDHYMKKQAQARAEKEAEENKADEARLESKIGDIEKQTQQETLRKEGKTKVEDLSLDARLDLAAHKAKMVCELQGDVRGLGLNIITRNGIEEIREDLAANKPFDAEKARLCMAQLCLLDRIIRGYEKNPEQFKPIAEAAMQEYGEVWKKSKTVDGKSIVEPTSMEMVVLNSAAFKKFTEDLTPEKLASFVNNNGFVKLSREIARENQAKRDKTEPQQQKNLQNEIKNDAPTFSV